MYFSKTTYLNIYTIPSAPTAESSISHTPIRKKLTLPLDCDIVKVLSYSLQSNFIEFLVVENIP